MNSYISTLILLFVATLMLSVFYWQVEHITLLQWLRFRLFARRDELRRLAIQGEEDPSSFAYKETEALICKTIATVPAISLASFVWFTVRHKSVPTESEKRFMDEASLGLQQIAGETVKDALRIMMLNSPILFAVGGFISAILWLFGRFNQAKVFRDAETFVDDLPLPA